MAEPGDGTGLEPASQGAESVLLLAGGDGDGDAEELVEVVDLEPPGPGEAEGRVWLRLEEGPCRLGGSEAGNVAPL